MKQFSPWNGSERALPRFYSGKIVLITWQQWLIYIGLACSGMASYASLISALYLRVPPTTVAALRTLQIVLAFIAQVREATNRP